MENGGANSPPAGADASSTAMREQGRTRSGSASSGHKRTLSDTLMSKLSFLRMSQGSDGDESFPADHRETDTEHGTAAETRTSAVPAMATAIQQRRLRRRRGSLRKTALLGTRLEVREKRSSSNVGTARSESHHHRSFGEDKSRFDQDTSSFDEIPPEDDKTPRASKTTKTTLSYWPRSLMKGAKLSPTRQQPATRTSLISDITDDEDDISISAFKNESSTKRPASVSSSGSAMPGPIATPSSSTDSYFALRRKPSAAAAAAAADSMALQMVRSNSSLRARSPLATHSTLEMGNHVVVDGGGWDYSETEWWGWTILVVTCFVFVVGMGSSFGVWSWAWDVGETPYAPPELEDDPTLPIVGYYPALLVLTAVMAWVWVVVAWVGMKYFKHANISGEDG